MERASDLVDGSLPPRQPHPLTLHLMICGGCRTYTEQLRGLKSMLRQRPPERSTEEAETVVLAALRVSDEEAARR
jgi:hypothetical protein